MNAEQAYIKPTQQSSQTIVNNTERVVMHGRAATAVSVSVHTTNTLSSDPNRDKLVAQRQQASTSATKDISSVPPS